MGFLDSLKDTAKNLGDQAKATAGNVKAAHAEKQAEKAEAERIAKEQAEAAKIEMAEKLLGGKSGKTKIFEINSMDDTIAFTKEYMVKLLLPASSLRSTKLKMMPYTDDKGTIREVSKNFSDYPDGEKIIFVLNNNTYKEYLAVTTAALYAKLAVKDNPDNFYSIKLPLADIETFTFESSEELHTILINSVPLMNLPKAARDADFVNLRYYFECLEKSDFEITDQEINDLIHEKIGEEAYNTAHKYMDDDELIIYFAWGLDSLTAKDFLMCTTEQFVYLDREAFGMAQNVKRFYYEDINSMSTEQENKDSLALTMLTAALQQCDLKICTAGDMLKIQTLSVKEAERVIQIYNGYKRAARAEAKKPVVVQAAAPAAADPLEQLAKLQKLKESGIISEEEFNAKKADLLAKL